jgi:glycosyltransferase involved in cell wall biosynthesis
MSDTNDENASTGLPSDHAAQGDAPIMDGHDVPYEARPTEDLVRLKSQMQIGDGARYGGYQYVAPPDEGSETRGIWLCHFASTRSGYAHVGHALAWALDKHLHLPVQLVPHRTEHISFDDLPSDRREDIRAWMGGKVGIGRALILTLPPQGAAQMNGYGETRTVCYTTHECDRVSPQTTEICNPGPDQGGFAKIWVKSPCAMRSFLAGGVRPERLRLVEPPLIGGPWTIPPVRGRDPGQPFRFGMLGTWIPRKGFERLLHAYYGAFTRADNVVLEIKTSPLNQRETIAQMEARCVATARQVREEARVADEDRARVIFRVGAAETDQEVIDWIADLDCFADSSCGEGLGIPQIYALAAGVPMVTSGFGAVGDLVTDLLDRGSDKHEVVGWQRERISRDMLAVSRMYDPGQVWGRMEGTGEFGMAMRRVYDRRDAQTFVRCCTSRDVVQRRFSFATCAPHILQALAELVDLDELSR